MSLSLPLLTGDITLSEALADESDVLQQLAYPEQRLAFYGFLRAHAGEIESIVSHHLGVPRNSCRAPWVDEWIHGSFNVCIPIYVDGRRRVVLRLPLPYKIGESTNPGNAEEKLRSEAATYAWIQTHCPSVPIPRLWGFGFPEGSSVSNLSFRDGKVEMPESVVLINNTQSQFTTLRKTPFHLRLRWHVRRAVAWLLGSPAASPYVKHQHGQVFTSGYLLLDYVDDGQMLSKSWDTLHNDANKRSVLFHDISRIMLSLAKVQFPRIGSLTIDNDGVVSLANRPLGLHLHQLENAGISTSIPRDLTYATTDTYLLDRLLCHESRIRYQPNSILDSSDGRSQLSALTMMRAVLPHFTFRDWKKGPFVLALTDLHPSNIFVDEDGHVTSLIDLEWTCSLPVEMLQPPYWLTNRAVDEIDQDMATFDQRGEEFISAFATNEKACGSSTPYADVMRAGWRLGNFWYFNAVDSFDGLYNLFLHRIQPKYGPAAVQGWKEFERSVAPYWAFGSLEFIDRKVKERERYLEQVKEIFREACSPKV